MKKNSSIKPLAYYEITEDPPQNIVNPVRTKTGGLSPLKLPKTKQYFFIDFTQDCSLRLMEKIEQKIQIKEPMQLQKYGKYVVTNVEDCSKQEQQLVKFQQQKKQMFQKKMAIRSKVKQNLDKSKRKLRSLSSFCIKQELIDQYSKPLPTNSRVSSIHQSVQSGQRASILQAHHKRLRDKQQKVLKRLGLYI